MHNISNLAICEFLQWNRNVSKIDKCITRCYKIIMTHKHIWKRDLTRKHKRPPRLFVICECGESAQAVIHYGALKVFKTRYKKQDGLVKKVRTFRASDYQMDEVEAGRLRIIVIGRRVTVAV